MPSMSVSVRAETLEAARAAAAAAGLTLSAWVDRTLSEAVWTRRFARQQERNAALGVTSEYLAGEFARIEELRRRAAG
ncbi:conserved hypothetical protein [Frankia sp. AiPs1]|uniref:hypothetical protein n=1 Tax=Frankia sp. AiPa1 TaxID=573492 RepID=UPI00202B1E79|nr:hypothetical protein [Frankia sp. AiPa1]MCL9758702.1 hypothetical protein [Frankia sp. AiPa1]